jgi:hypothetical protein
MIDRTPLPTMRSNMAEKPGSSAVNSTDCCDTRRRNNDTSSGFPCQTLNKAKGKSLPCDHHSIFILDPGDPSNKLRTKLELQSLRTCASTASRKTCCSDSLSQTRDIPIRKLRQNPGVPVIGITGVAPYLLPSAKRIQLLHELVRHASIQPTRTPSQTQETLGWLQ